MLSTLETLQEEASDNGIGIEIHKLSGDMKGFYYSSTITSPSITIDLSVRTQKEETCIMAEELGHHYTSYGNLILEKMDKYIVRKQEEQAKRWAVYRLVRIDDFIKAFKVGVHNKYEVAEYLDITEEFLDKTIEVYYRKYGICKRIDDWVIYFNPFGFMRMDF